MQKLSINIHIPSFVEPNIFSVQTELKMKLLIPIISPASPFYNLSFLSKILTLPLTIITIIPSLQYLLLSIIS
jgi:hypothetical protein